MRLLLLLLLCMPGARAAAAQDTAFIRVHFIYGSKPAKHYHQEEKKWFGGILGGHVGIEGDSDRILNFFPSGRFHWFGHRRQPKSTYAVYRRRQFDGFFGGHPDSIRKAIICIPVTSAQKQLFDSISAAYLKQSPYDYAFIGMRCAAASYEVLGQLGIVPRYSRNGIVLRIFYPKRLRKRLLREAAVHHWTVVRQEGTQRRRWERD